MYWNIENKKVVNDYIEKSMLNKLLYVDRGLDIVEAFSEYINAYYSNQDEKYNKLANSLWKSDTMHIKNVFEGKEYGALIMFLGDDLAQTFRTIWNNATNYTYTMGYCRRSYRSNKSSELYLRRNIEKLEDFVYLVASEFTLDKYFTDNKADYKDISVIADILAFEIDRNNNVVFNKIKEVIYNDNNTAIVTREIIRGLLMSKNPEAHKIIGELLLAAKLQEGLRQAIVESMDECSREGFIYILKLIIDNNLIRFSSVARAFGTWTGLFQEVQKPKVIQKCFEAAYNCLTNKAYKNECIASNDNLLIYIGIWAVAFDEVHDIGGVLSKLLSSHEKYKKLVALQFLYDTQFNSLRHQFGCYALEDNDLEVIALALKNLFGDLNSYNLIYSKDDLKSFSKLRVRYCGITLFNRLKAILDVMPKKEIEFNGSVFPWVDFTLTKEELIEKMMMSIVLSYSAEEVETLIDYKESMNAEERGILINAFLQKPENVKQKKALLKDCGDRSQSVRESAFKVVNSLELNSEDYIIIENLLQYKSGDLRKNAIKLILKKSDEELTKSIKNLLESSNENKRLAAIDIVSALGESKEHSKIFKSCTALVSSIKDLSQKEMLLVQNIVEDTKITNNLQNGFGLYDISKSYAVPAIDKPNDTSLNSYFSMSTDEFKSILNKFSNLIYKHRDFEYETEYWDGTKKIVTLGGEYHLEPFKRGNTTLDNYPLAEDVRKLAKEIGLEAMKLIELDFYTDIMEKRSRYLYLPWYEELLNKNFNYTTFKELGFKINEIPFYNKIISYISLLTNEINKTDKFKIGKLVSEYIYYAIPPEKYCQDYFNRKAGYYNGRNISVASADEIKYWLRLMENNLEDDKSFSEYFTIAYNYYKASKYESETSLNLQTLGRALELGIIDENEIYRELLERSDRENKISEITDSYRYNRNDLTKYNKLMEIGNKAADAVAGIEVKRGELDTEVSHLALKLKKCHGVSVFISIILASEKDTYVRGYNFIYGDSTKKQMLSHLLKCCYPKEGENARTLGEYLKGKKITSKQLIEAAMYSPQWLDIVSEYLGYEGMKSACWYFHAHMNDYFSNEKSAVVARYTPISADDLKDGAFDQKWFMEAYNSLGEKNFKLVYDSAKYIAGGGLHKRAQLFADATLGKLDAYEIKKRVMDKRNKDYLLTYGLIPVKDKEDALERYEYIHQYIKESKQFGAQRQASEGRSASIALFNLAHNIGYSDVNRLTWNMETAKIDSIRSYLQPQKIEDIEIQLAVDELGQAEIVCLKGGDGKALKSIPAKLKNNEYVLKLKELKKSLKNQYARARQCFEVAMENGDIFKVEELLNLCKNPVLAPIIKNLIFKAGDKLGFISGDSLVDYENKSYKLSTEEDVIIAHPVHMYKARCWSHYQKFIFSTKILQPFKQVFRELYLPNADELSEKTISRRYAGNQIQPRKTAALLKGRGWLASYEEGLMKVYYEEDIIATIYAIADWFSPSDIEAPTIEFVRFEDRKTYIPIPIDKIPELIFSEVMRDVDLAVSVAHVGGVDPEASLSTVEIRTAIVLEILKLMKLSNVVLKGTHAHITGVHGEYTVHLGSGVVHKMGVGAINILPVHSGHRGRIFLPFIDGDPKSAEIISKIIFLAEDKKIKDPSVLEQISC